MLVGGFFATRRRRALRAAWPGLAACAAALACEPARCRAQPEDRAAAPAADWAALHRRIKAHVDGVRAIDTHDHLEFERVPGLYTLWRESYFGPHLPALGTRDEHVPVATWWPLAQEAFANGRAMGLYRYQLPAFRDLYGVDFNKLTQDGAERLDAAILERYRDPNWVRHVVTERSNVELLVIDYDYTPYDYVPPYDYGVAVVRLNPLVRGFHRTEYANDAESPYGYAERHGLRLDSLDDYRAVLEHIMRRAADRGAVGMKSTLAYSRTLRYENASDEEAAVAFGRERRELSPAQVKAFEDWVFWRFCELSEKYELPLQIHTGYAFANSNPMHLENVVAAHPRTRFMLFHGGFPWVGETGMMLMRYPKNVWIDSNWLPTLSATVARRAFHEWLDMVPSNRLLWGSDTLHAEGLYGATAVTRACLAEVLAERVARGELEEADACRIGTQILRENAIAAFPRLQRRFAKSP